MRKCVHNLNPASCAHCIEAGAPRFPPERPGRRVTPAPVVEREDAPPPAVPVEKKPLAVKAAPAAKVPASCSPTDAPPAACRFCGLPSKGHTPAACAVAQAKNGGRKCARCPAANTREPGGRLPDYCKTCHGNATKRARDKLGRIEVTDEEVLAELQKPYDAGSAHRKPRRAKAQARTEKPVAVVVKPAPPPAERDATPVQPAPLQSLSSPPAPAIATPEPPPRNLGIEVTPPLVLWLRSLPLDEDILTELVAGVEARSAFGREKYGQPLMTGDGRDSVNDARQEGIDLLQYAFKAHLNGEDLEQLVPLARVILRLVDASGGANTYHRRVEQHVETTSPGAAASAEARIAQLEQAALVPGQMRCGKCGFELQRTTLYMKSGTAGPGDNETEPCPNGCGPLWPKTWEQEARACWAADNTLAGYLEAIAKALGHTGGYADLPASVAALRVEIAQLRQRTEARIESTTAGELSLPPVVMGMVDTLMVCGLWGTTREAVLERLVCERLRDLAREGLLVLR